MAGLRCLARRCPSGQPGQPALQVPCCPWPAAPSMFGSGAWACLPPRRAHPLRPCPRPAAGFQGEGVKTIVPHRAFVKLAARLVPDQTPNEVGALPAQLEGAEPGLKGWQPVAAAACLPPSRPALASEPAGRAAAAAYIRQRKSLDCMALHLARRAGCPQAPPLQIEALIEAHVAAHLPRACNASIKLLGFKAHPYTQPRDTTPNRAAAKVGRAQGAAGRAAARRPQAPARVPCWGGACSRPQPRPALPCSRRCCQR